MSKWCGIVKVCTDSPSGIAWDFDLYITETKIHPKVKVGKFAGSKDDKGRWSFMYIGTNHYCHRVIYELLNNCELPDNLVVDHLDGNPSNNSHNNFEVKTDPQNSRNRRKSKYNTSGNTGVYFAVKRGKTVVIAKCRTLESMPKTKIFSVEKLGIMVAYRLAVLHRAKMIEILNSQGAMYTERHGKETH